MGAVKWGWALIWSLGTNAGAGIVRPASWAASSRMLDPTLGTGLTPAVPDGAHAVFEAAWSGAAAARAAASPSPPSNGTTAEWWSTLEQKVAGALWIEPVMAGVCADPHRCVGITRSRVCVCYL